MNSGLNPRERAAQAKRDRSRQALIGAAVDLVVESRGLGYRVEDIAAAAGVSLATLYNHFETKADLIRAAFERVVEPVTAPINRAVEAGSYNPPDPRAELIRWIFDVASLLHDHAGLVAEVVRVWTENNLQSLAQGNPAPTLSRTLRDVLLVQPEFSGGLGSLKLGVHGSDAWEIASYHMHMLVLQSCRRELPDLDYHAAVANRTLNQLIPAITGDHRRYSRS